MRIKLNGNILKMETYSSLPLQTTYKGKKRSISHTNCSSCISRKHRRGVPLVQKLPFHSFYAYTNHSVSRCGSRCGVTKHPSTNSDRFLPDEFVSFTLLLIRITSSVGVESVNLHPRTRTDFFVVSLFLLLCCTVWSF
jgi:hypothetical protein